MSLRVGFATIWGAKAVSRSILVPKGDALSGAEGFSIVLLSLSKHNVSSRTSLELTIGKKHTP